MDRGSTATAAFFQELARRGHVAILEEISGTMRFDLRDEDGIDHWWVAIERGDVRVKREDGPADCVLHTDRTVFDQMASGKLHQLPAWLRHLFVVEGKAHLFRVFANVFPGPAGARDPRDLVSNRRRR